MLPAKLTKTGQALLAGNVQLCILRTSSITTNTCHFVDMGLALGILSPHFMVVSFHLIAKNSKFKKISFHT